MRINTFQFNHLRIVFSCLFAAALLAAPAIAFANCSDLNSNATWNKGLAQLQKQVESAKFNEALETAKPLFAICQDSPALLYFTGQAMQGTGDEERARIYFQKASESLSIMAAEPGLSRQIWYTRYESEHPESSPDAIKENHQTIETLKKQVTDLTEQNHHLELSSVSSAVSTDEESRHYQQVLWSGVGIGIGGLAFAATGIALAVNSDAAKVDNLKLSEEKLHAAGWILLGSGIGLTAAGVIMTAIGGYHYSTMKDDAIMSFQFSRVGASFGMTF